MKKYKTCIKKYVNRLVVSAVEEDDWQDRSVRAYDFLTRINCCGFLCLE